MELGHPNYVDNAYLVMLIELGIAGLAAFILLVLGVFRSILPHRSALSASQVVSLAAILVFALLAANFATSQGYALFWLVAGLAVATADYEAQGRSYVRGGT
jgi:FtsH-binding integral membrane protein